MLRKKILSLGLLCALFCVQLGSTIVSAQEQTEKVITVKSGEILEFLGFSSSPNMTYTWVLEQNGTFLQATRNPFFQSRLTQAGNYVLNVEVVDIAGTVIRRAIPVIVEERTGEVLENPQVNSLVTTEPALDAKNRIVKEMDGDIITLIPARDDISVLIADLNTAYDSNGDGFSDNDEDTADTAFRTGHSHLRVWILDPQTKQDIRITGITTTEESVTQNMSMLSRAALDGESGDTFFPPDVQTDGSASSTSVPGIPDGTFGVINASAEPTGAIRFSVSLRDFSPEDPLLLHWDFGDTRQSLLSNPVHTYVTPGTYTVTLSVRDLRSGEELAVLSTDVAVTGLPGISSSSSESSSSSSQEVIQPVDNSSSSIGSLIFKLLAAFVIAGGAGALIAFLFSRIRRGKTLEQTFADAEKNLMGNVAESQVVDLPPLQLADEPETTIEEADTMQSQHTAMAPELEELKTETEKAPNWLKPGIERAEEMDLSITTPVPPALQSEPAPPAPAVSSPAPEPDSYEELPDWLQQQPQTPPTPAPEPVTDTQVVSEPAHTPLTPELNTLETKKEDAPGWLQVGLKQAEQEGMSVASPVPEPLAPEQESPPLEPVLPVSVPMPEIQPPQKQMTPEELAREERLREKRREKRKRYRENKKNRESAQKTGDATQVAAEATSPSPVLSTTEPTSVVKPAGADSTQNSKTILQSGEISEDEPVAYIRADSIEEQQKGADEPQNPAA